MIKPQIADKLHKSLEQVEQDMEHLRKFAIESGAADAKVIPTSLIEVDERARYKCMYPPCRWYGSSAICPPHLKLTPDVTERLVGKYKYGILIKLEMPPAHLAGPEWTELHKPHELKLKEVVAGVMGEAFNMGYHLNLGFAAGECSICLPKGLECTAIHGMCRDPFKAIPAMEAAGIDVFTTVRNVGWEIYPIGATTELTDVPCAGLYGLVLVH